MPEFHRAGRDRINAFHVDGTYFFKHYLDDETFAELSRYYDEYDYRFEIPESRFEHVREVLQENGYAPVVVETVTPLTVVKRKYTKHPKSLFRGSVLHRSVANFNCFVMKDRDAVDQAVTDGATPIEETDIDFSP